MGRETADMQDNQHGAIVAVKREKEINRKRKYKARRAVTADRTINNNQLDEAVKQRRTLEAIRKRKYRARKAIESLTVIQSQPSTGLNDQIPVASFKSSSILTTMQTKREKETIRKRKYRARKAATAGIAGENVVDEESIIRKRASEAARKWKYRAKNAIESSLAVQPQPSASTYSSMVPDDMVTSNDHLQFLQLVWQKMNQLLKKSQCNAV